MLNLQSMQRIHKLIEAQKNFLRYYEMREKLDEKRSRESARAKSQSESQPQSFEPYTFHSSSSTSRDTRGQTEEKTKDTISSDSDKENSSRAINSSRPSRKAELYIFHTQKIPQPFFHDLIFPPSVISSLNSKFCLNGSTYLYFSSLFLLFSPFHPFFLHQIMPKIKI